MLKPVALEGKSVQDAPGEALFDNQTQLKPLGVDYRGAAQLTSLSVSRLQKLVMLKLVPHVKVGRRVVFIPKQLEAWLIAKQESTHVSR